MFALPVHLSVDTGYFHFLAVVSDAAAKAAVQTSQSLLPLTWAPVQEQTAGLGLQDHLLFAVWASPEISPSPRISPWLLGAP